jgi:hypothetical protein
MGRPSDGISASFVSRREADLAVEHLVQEYGIERGVIFVESAGEAGTTGTHIAGGDAASGEPTTDERTDAPLEGEIRLTVAVKEDERPGVDRVLREAGAHRIRRVS